MIISRNLIKNNYLETRLPPLSDAPRMAKLLYFMVFKGPCYPVQCLYMVKAANSTFFVLKVHAVSIIERFKAKF